MPRARDMRIARRSAAVVLSFALCAVGCDGCEPDITINGSNPDEVAFVCLATQGADAYTCQCTCVSEASGMTAIDGKNIGVCLPPELNQCQGGEAAEDADLVADCEGRVQPTVQGMVRVVQGDPTIACTC